jgi:predicted dehydrogenase
MSEKLRAVLVGCGNMSNGWLKPAVARDDLEVVGLVDIREEAAREMANQYGLDVALGTDLDSVLKKTAADVIFDCTVPEAHTQVTLTALENGCHVLGEKPMADTMEHAREMVAAAERAGRIYSVIQNRRYLPQIRAVRDFLSGGKLGAITTVQTNFFIGAHFGGFRDVMDHVLILDMAIHTFDAARYVVDADATSVFCNEWNPKGSWYKHGASAVAIFEMTKDIVYTYQGSWCAEGCQTNWESDWHIICENGSLHWDGADAIRAEYVAGTDGFSSDLEPATVTVREMLEVDRGHSGLIGDFVTAVTTGKPPLTVCTDNIKSLAMVHGAIASAESRQLVNL